MKHKFLTVAIILYLAALPAFMSCSPDNEPSFDTIQTNSPDDNKPENNGGDDIQMNTSFKIKVGTETFSATLENNVTARAFAALLPMTIVMNELNGNEKYHYLDGSLPTDVSRPGTVRAGDLMLYGSNCIVIFYETFSSSYSYTRIGHVNDPVGFTSLLGRGNVTISFEQ